MQRLSNAVRRRKTGKDVQGESAGAALLAVEDAKEEEANKAHELEQVELQLVEVLKQNGVAELCRTIKSEIDTIWAVQTAFKTLASVGHFYFSCGEQVFAVSPADGFYDSDGLLLALFALKKFPHQREVIFPILDTISIYAKLDVERALSFCAVDDGVQLLMDCVRNHYDKPELICLTQEALGSLVLNDDIRLHIASTPLLDELLELLRRFKPHMEVARALLYPLSHLVVLKEMANHFVERNGIPTALQCLQMHKDDQQATWYALALLNALATDSYHTTLIGTVFDHRGVHMIARAVAKHVEVEEIVLEGLQLLETIAGISDLFPVINQNHVLELAYHALALYKGAQYTHTRLEIKRRLLAFQTCAIQDGRTYATQERITKGDSFLYTLFLLFTAIAAALSPYDQHTASQTAALKTMLSVPASFASPDSVWSYLSGPFVAALFPPPVNVIVTPQMLGASNILLGSIQLRQERFNQDGVTENTSTSLTFGSWVAADAAQSSHGGYLATLPNCTVLAPACQNDPLCVLVSLRSSAWIDAFTRRIAIEFNIYNAALDVHAPLLLSLDFQVAGDVHTSLSIKPTYFNVYRGVFLTSVAFYVDMGMVVLTVYSLYRAAMKLNRYRQYYFYIAVHVVDFSIAMLWVSIWCTRVQFLTTASFALMLQLAQSSFISLQPIAALAQQERVLFAIVSLIMWLNWTRYLSFHNLRYLLCVLDATSGFIVAYVVIVAVTLLGVTQYWTIMAPQTATPVPFVDFLVNATSAVATRSVDPSPDLFFFFCFNLFLPLIGFYLLAPLFRFGFNICPREPPKRPSKPIATSLKGHRPTVRTAFRHAKAALHRVLEERQQTIRKHSFSPWERSDASLADDITEEKYVNPAAPAPLQELQRGVVQLAVAEQHLDILATNLLKRLQQLHLMLRSNFSRSIKSPLEPIREPTTASSAPPTPKLGETRQRSISQSYAQRRYSPPPEHLDVDADKPLEDENLKC
ncbi:Aste57867_12490 [Aphanomyces stellatus]|uniref:Aste57867_12490 protein n=1 Tax=Aphanomyces stellatus TaxID=120398 RepID=A0A485KXP3_9STRA|nr:hypothetical protein As57867_012444 [Aphanomyces stellatus]VFT89341.1 Aste57867_12490 [Aphanomyces stellatus]